MTGYIRRNGRGANGGYRVGEGHHRAKLPDAECERMRETYARLNEGKRGPNRVGYGAMARMFNCGESTARDIIRQRTRAQ